SEAAQLVGIMPPTVWGREIVRLSRRLDLDVMTVQAEVLKASSGPGDAERQRGDLDLRDDVHGYQRVPRNTAELVAESYPHPMTGVLAEAPTSGTPLSPECPEIGVHVRAGR